MWSETWKFFSLFSIAFYNLDDFATGEVGQQIFRKRQTVDADNSPVPLIHVEECGHADRSMTIGGKAPLMADRGQ